MAQRAPDIERIARALDRLRGAEVPVVEHDVSPTDVADLSLRHVLVVGGDVAEWAELTDERWAERVAVLGEFCAQVGVPWLTIRLYEEGADAAGVALQPWTHRTGECTVLVDPCGCGRDRFAEAMQRLDPADEVNEATVAAVLYEPADCEPDLVVVLGPPTQLPPSLVWELAYAELVFLPTAWSNLGVPDLVDAIADFGGRRRRFGGLDDE
jgi:Putative undecaprenyl diphosphate synthase